MDSGRIDGVGGPGRIDGIRAASRIQRSEGTADVRRPDQVSVSPQAEMVAKVLQMPALRQERIDEVRRLVESGKFDTEERLDGALKKFMEENPDVL